MINWQTLHQLNQIEQIDDLSRNQFVLVFKHSTRCSISRIAKSRLESSWGENTDGIIPFCLDLIQHRNISDSIAAHYGVYHESPQTLLISHGNCISDLSHMDINVDHILASIKTVVNK